MKNTKLFSFLRSWWFVPSIATILTFILVMTLAVGQSVWFDEGYSILLAKQSFAELYALTAVDAHPPFYYALLKVWGDTFGFNEGALRTLSAIAASLSVGVVILIARKLFTPKTALIVAPFLIFAPFALRYGYEIRMYAVAALIGALATLVLLYATQTNKRRYWIVYAVLVALGMWTLYMMVALWLAHAVWLLVKTIKEKKNLFKQTWVYAFILAVVLFVPYIATFIYQNIHSALPGIGSQLTLTKLGGIFSALLTYQADWEVNGIISILIVLLIGLVIFIHVKVRPTLSAQQKNALTFVYFLAFIPFAFFALASLNKPIFVNRYMAHIALFVYLLLGVTVALGLQSTFRKAAIALAGVSGILLVSGVFVLSNVGNVVFERVQRPQSAAVRESIDCKDTVIVANDPYTYIDSTFYFDGCDQRFFAKENVEYKGGYAYLHDSSKRIESSDAITAKTIVHQHWVGDTPEFTVDGRYGLVSTQTFEKQVVDTYVLNR